MVFCLTVADYRQKQFQIEELKMKNVWIIILCLFMLTACASPPNIQQAPVATEDSLLSSTTQCAEPETTVMFVSFTAYRGNENADGLLSREVQVPEITPSVVLSALIDDGVVPSSVTVLTLNQKDQQLQIDFNDAFLQHLCSMGTAGETMLIGSVVNTFLSAYDAQSVIITVNGEIPESGHVVYDFPLTHQE